MQQRTEIPLAFPVDFDGEQVSCLSLRRPTGADLELISDTGNPTGQSILMIANLAERSPDFVRAMDASDVLKVGDWVKECMAGPLPAAPKG